MQKLLFFIGCLILYTGSYAQYRWELSGGITNSSLNLENTETTSGIGYYLSAGYGYISGVRAKTSIVFSIEALQRSSELTEDLVLAEGIGNISRGSEFTVTQFGFSPKFRYLFFTGKDRFRPFINVGPSLRFTANAELGDTELESEAYEQLMIGGVYGVGFSQMIGEQFDIFFEAGAMNDFLDNLNDVKSKFFDIYARIGVRFRIYDARR
ncbi:outer membrane beta-barrel protein [Aquimarina sp. ERC-38]|uniref:outer membrane beta-barrel protein n=1 Tax=Aquimarina sp. ERC-38 TaxID=2949996 RepID=UPI0022482D74|nr:outer membrane beta-barrel protein [Aquimarina sp. ERC-38]UZO79696.1 outer membrane beta-barrel protein [Aquimarina sp. ERC-38]